MNKKILTLLITALLTCGLILLTACGDDSNPPEQTGQPAEGGQTYGGGQTAHNHAIVIDEAIEPTCTSDGKTEGAHCGVCMEIIKHQQIIPILPHQYIHHEAKGTTCISVGWKAYDTCANCSYSTYEEIGMADHSLTHHEAIPNTCTEIGAYEYWSCSECNTDFLDEDATAVIDCIIIPASHILTHNEAKQPTCTEIGWDAYDTCSRCGYSTYNELSAKGHDYIRHEAKAESCTEIGWSAYDTCSRCDYSTYNEIAANGHDYIRHEAKAESCTEIGWSAYDTCSRCNYSTYREIAAKGHDYIYHSSKDATCTSVGWNEYESCSRCDYTTYHEIAALNHSLTHYEAIGATCTQSGAVEYYSCSSCGKKFADYDAETEITETVIPAAHTFDGGSCTACGALKPTDGLVYSPINAGTEYEVSDIGTATDSEIIIADMYNGLPVTSIGWHAFDSCNTITKVTIPDSITYIDYYAFDGCKNLENVIIGDGVKIIGDAAFTSCVSLTSISIPSSVVKIGANAFAYCENLLGVSFSDNSSLESIDVQAFAWCYKLRSFDMPDSVTSIGSSVFANCYKLENLKVSNNVTSLPESLLYGCSALKSVSLPCAGITKSVSGCTYYYPFGSIFGTTNYEGSIATYQYQHYEKSSSFGSTSITYYLPASLRTVIIYGGELSHEEFRGCKNLTSIIFGDGVTKITGDVFNGCTSLSSLTIGNNVTQLSGNSLDKCTALQYNEYDNAYYLGNESNPYLWLIRAKDTSVTSCEIHSDTKFIHSHAFLDCKNLANVNIPESVQSICSYSFSGCTALTSIHIPAGVTSIESGAFSDCRNLVEVYNSSSLNITKGSYGNGSVAYYALGVYTDINTESKVVTLDGGYIFYDGDDGVYFIGYKGNNTELILPESYNGQDYRIKLAALADCDGIQSITVPFIGESKDSANKTHFGYIFGAASYQDNGYYIPASLKTVVVTGGSAIGYMAFANCSEIQNITIPSNVTKISSNAFMGCESLESFVIPDSVTYIGSAVFYNCSSLTSITIPFIGERANAAAYTNFGYIFGANTSADNKKYVPATLKTVIITHASAIQEGAFSGCSWLESITLPFVGGSIKTQDDTYQYPFGYIFGTTSYYGSIATVQNYYGASLSEVETATYYIPASLRSVTITGGNILSGAFSDCSEIEYIAIPESITSIGYMAFSECINLKEINIPNGVTSIAPGTFNKCMSLESVIIPDSVELIDFFAFAYCENLMHITLGKGVTTIVGSGPDDAFFQCIKLVDICNKSSLVIEKGSSENGCIGYYAINIYTPDSGESTLDMTDGGYVFCSDDTTAYLIGYLGDNTELTLPENYNGNGYEIYEYAFWKCDGITSIIMPDSVTNIGDYAFYYCTGLKNLVISSGVTSLKEGLLYSCSALESLTLPFIGGSIKAASDTYQYPLGYIFGTSSYTGSVEITQKYYGYSTTKTESKTYYFPASLKSVTVTGGIIPYGAFYDCSSLRSVTIGDNVASIGDYSFYNCHALRSVTIGKSVASIETNAFPNCHNLVEVYNTSSLNIVKGSSFNGHVSQYAINVYTDTSIPTKVEYCDDGYVFYNDADNVYLLGYEGSDTALLLPYSYDGKYYEINAYAFYNSSSITSITIPSGITSIGDRAFYNCTNLADISIGYGVARIGELAFYNCISIKDIQMPVSITDIDYGAFYGCTGLTSITIPDSVTKISNLVFKNCSNLTSITFADTSTWFMTDNVTFWNNTSNGNVTYLTNASTNATYFKSTYLNYYWYKM